MISQETLEANERMLAWFRGLTSAQKVERLKSCGILDSGGELSSSYGGPGKATRTGDADSLYPTHS